MWHCYVACDWLNRQHYWLNWRCYALGGRCCHATEKKQPLFGGIYYADPLWDTACCVLATVKHRNPRFVISAMLHRAPQ